MTLIGLPASLKHISTDDLDLGDPNRIEIYNYLNDYQKILRLELKKGFTFLEILVLGSLI